MIHRDPKAFEPAAIKYLPDMSKKVVGPTVQAYLTAVQAWPQNGGDLSMLADTIKHFTRKGELKPGLKSETFVNSSILEKALRKLGKVSGAR
jgi:hypothetical protein